MLGSRSRERSVCPSIFTGDRGEQRTEKDKDQKRANLTLIGRSCNGYTPQEHDENRGKRPPGRRSTTSISHSMPTNRGVFELTILGCSGGPISGKTCSFMLKPADVDYAAIVSQDGAAEGALLVIDAGTGLTSLVDILQSSSTYMESCFLLELYPQNWVGPSPSESKPTSIKDIIATYVNTQNLAITAPLRTLQTASTKSNLQLADDVLNSIGAYLITHPHLDHVASLVINSPAFSSPKAVYGLPDTLASIKDNLFNGLVWPDLVSMGIVALHPLAESVQVSCVSKRYNITPFKVSHGISATGSRYISTAFLITDTKHDSSILLFGDVESDGVANCNYNRAIWTRVAPLITANKLNTLVIECSTVDKPPPLFGHMTPSNLIHELSTLRKLCVDHRYPDLAAQNLRHDHKTYIGSRYQPLAGFNVIVVHVKETLEDVNPRCLILQRLNTLNTSFNLKVNFTMALSGLSFVL